MKKTKDALSYAVGMGHAMTFGKWRFDTVVLFQPQQNIYSQKSPIKADSGNSGTNLNTKYKAVQTSLLFKASIKL